MKVLCVSKDNRTKVTFDLDAVTVTDENVPTGYEVEEIISTEDAVAKIIALKKKGYTLSELTVEQSE